MADHARNPARACLFAALLLSVAAAGLHSADQRPLGSMAAFVHVRWAPGVDAAQRQTLERRFSLTASEPTEGTTYSYLLLDTSTENIRNLITQREVLDTHDLDRSAFTVAPAAESVSVADPAAQRVSRRLLAASAMLWRGAAALGLLGLILYLAPAPALRQAEGMRAAAWSPVRALYSRVPEVSAEGAALFRIVFGGAVVVLFVLSPIRLDDLPLGPQPEGTPWLKRVIGDAFLAWPGLVNLIGPWLAISGACFVAGAFTRLAFAAFALGAVAWGAVYSLHSGHHPISALLVALLCLLPARWGDAWSLDAWLRRPRPASPREYGYTVWIPGVVLGISLAAAAASKLLAGGIGWILNGTVKYHILTDAASAPVDWGLRFALAPAVAVALSFATIVVESLVLPVALIGSWRVRLATALAIASMFTGFWLLQGVYWPAWWILLLSFAPWQFVRPHGTVRDLGGARSLTLRYIQAGFLVVAVGQQVVASTWRLEVPPILSAYDMYSRTYATPEEYPATAGASYQLIATMADLTTSSCRLDNDEAEMFASLPHSKTTPGAAAVLASCFGAERVVRSVAVEQWRPHVDWAAGRYLGTIRVPVSGPVTLVGDDGG